MGSNRSVVARGIIGGVLGATAIVIFFLIVDVVQGEALRTPAFLASVLTGRGEAEAGFGVIALFTLFHYAAFVGVGILLAWVFDRARLPAPLLLGLVVGFLLFDVVFYASVWITGTDVVAVLGWPSFLVGNLLAGLVLMSYLGRSGPQPTVSWRELMEEHNVWRDGLMAGLLGAVAVAGWFFLTDLVMGRLLFTPAALGSALFDGVNETALVHVSATTVLGYSVFHIGAFLATGLLFAAIVDRAEENPSFLLALILMFVTVETLAIGLVAIVAAWLLDVLAWWNIMAANLVAAAVMGWYLWRRHPGLDEKLSRAEDPQAVERERTGDGAVARGGR